MSESKNAKLLHAGTQVSNSKLADRSLVVGSKYKGLGWTTEVDPIVRKNGSIASGFKNWVGCCGINGRLIYLLDGQKSYEVDTHNFGLTDTGYECRVNVQ